MKSEGHPNYHKVKIVLTDGTEYDTYSCWGKEGDVMRLDIDPLSHPAWKGFGAVRIENEKKKNFDNKFGSFLATGKKA